ncbi:DUF5074 domain-containing protein [Christiangramia aquimixticola]|uniref:DUF5074 domain-containing protein n=1 Tax=Christiangramia aquimixticola TaxID=1697558 RepID=UPI003AA900E9
MKKRLFSLFMASTLLFSCSSDDDCCPVSVPESDYEKGIIVLNEGNFGSGNASVSFLNTDTGTINNAIYVSVNGIDLGDTAQSIEIHEELAFIVVNVSNKIEVVNRFTFKNLGTINSNLDNPRYVEVVGDEIYVTNWGDGMNKDDDFVAIYNLSDFSFKEKVAVAEGPEKVMAYNQNLYVAHKGGFGYNNIISVLDSSSKEVAKEIEVGYLPNSMVIEGSNLFVLSSGKPAYADEETAGSLSFINLSTNELMETKTFQSISTHPANLIFSNGSYYFNVDKAVYTYKIGESLPSAPQFVLNDVDVLYGLEVKDERLYIASPNSDFTGNGKLNVYDAVSGNLLNSYSAGINPNSIYFN